ncbi:lysophospholipid acyltransferase family protein [Candidatus Dactylopiibacterium carminicum]|uniref:lysophospholipid acyltransferase family protein n=1 Tax=Candidatus Dactylopiibacterium carminicum TaxID=857335 RepID=UPI001CC2E132|nr:lysophospholipid acyltransferase family protein [Candidatus Dactylopiibacterium carminicum]
MPRLQLLPFLFRLLGRCSLPCLHHLGGLGGMLAHALSPRLRRHLRENYARALGRQPTLSERLENARETGRMMLELPFVWQRPLDEVMAHVVEVRGMEHMDALRAEGSTLLALTPHMGCFEITSLYMGRFMPFSILYRPPKQKAIEPLLRAGRERGQLTLVTADLSGVRQIIKGLRQGIATGLLPDQAPGKGEGIWSPFFGRPAYTMTLAARLSEVKNTRVLLFWGERLPGRGWRLHIVPPRRPIEGSLEERVHAINHELETLILRCPAQYLWAYNRYKTPAGAPQPTVNGES